MAVLHIDARPHPAEGDAPPTAAATRYEPTRPGRGQSDDEQGVDDVELSVVFSDGRMVAHERFARDRPSAASTEPRRTRLGRRARNTGAKDLTFVREGTGFPLPAGESITVNWPNGTVANRFRCSIGT